MNRQTDRISTLIGILRRGDMCAVPSTVLITVQENLRLAHRMLCASDDTDPTAASIARNAVKAACSAMDSYAGERT